MKPEANDEITATSGWADELDALAANPEPVFFFVSADASRGIVSLLDKTPGLSLDFRGEFGHWVRKSTKESRAARVKEVPRVLSVQGPPKETWHRSFGKLHEHIVQGESWLANLCARSRVEIGHGLVDVFTLAGAPYKVHIEANLGTNCRELVSFSPECFIRCRNGTISTFPMKGTFLADERTAVEAGAAMLLGSPKESAEHLTVCDLMRNEIGRVAHRVSVPIYRSVETVASNGSFLLQTTSRIEGRLLPEFSGRPGSLLRELLPAGSVSGAPKVRTCQLLRELEAPLLNERGWYSGVFGIYHAGILEAAIAIRYIERDTSGQTWFLSGAGITSSSSSDDEYSEIMAKIRIPGSAAGEIPRLFETVRVDPQGQTLRARNMEFHLSRMDQTCASYDVPPLPRTQEQVERFLATQRHILAEAPCDRYKLRIEYDRGLRKLELERYTIRRPRTLFLVDASRLQYQHKFVDRSALEDLKNSVDPCGEADWDILLTLGDDLLEVSYANIVLSIDGRLCTPESVLLHGTARDRYLSREIISPRRLKTTDIGEGVFLINAMISLEDQVFVPGDCIIHGRQKDAPPRK